MDDIEFSGIRSQLYKEALYEYPNARLQDIKLMKKYLAPKKGEVILEVGAGSGFFSGIISDKLGKTGKLIVTDPSDEQLDDVRFLNKSNIEVYKSGSENINLPSNSIDKIWSLGAMHHCFNKQKSFDNFYNCLKSGGTVIIIDVFSDSKLAKHFDERVSKYCITGHEVAFWTKEYAESICYLSGFENPVIKKLNVKWIFDTREDIGKFLYKLHAMTKTNPKECLIGAEKILGVIERKGKFELNWPMGLIFVHKK